MNNELVIKNGSKKHTVYLQDGFYYTFSPARPSAPFHKHNYAEIHIVSNGTTEFKIGDILHSSDKGNLIIIPANVFHCITNKEPSVYHAAFQINCEVEKFISQQVSQQIVYDFMNEIERCKETHNYAAVSAYISLFCSYLHLENLSAQEVADYGFLIYEFLSTHYNEDLRISDLAKALHLSERHTERLVIKYTGHSFRDELSKIRINIAKHLLNTSEMTLAEISRYVGYRSYSGFWKAMKKDI